MRKNNKNTVKLIGRVYSFGDKNRKILAEKITGADAKSPNTPYINGVINIAIDEEGLNIVPVEFTYITETTSTGNVNRTFGVLKQLIENKKTWAESGKDEAPKIQITASMALNDFPDPNDETKMVAAKFLSGNFVEFVDVLPEDEYERNRFEVDVLITNAAHIEADEEKGIETDYTTVRAAAFDFRNAILPFTFTVRDPDGMVYFENLGASNEDPIFTKVYGYINCASTVRQVEEKTAWGNKPVVKKIPRKVNEYVIDQAAYEPYEFGDEAVLTGEEVMKALQDREVHLAEQKKRSDDYKASKKTSTASAAVPATITKKGFNF